MALHSFVQDVTTITVSNDDGEVDYLGVMKASENNIHSNLILALTGKDQYQDLLLLINKKTLINI